MHPGMRNCIYPPVCSARRMRLMRIAKPILLVSTPLGIVTGLIEAYRMVGGLVIVMFAMMSVLGAAFAGLALTIRREKKWTQSRS
jgi:hypothetical protein